MKMYTLGRSGQTNDPSRTPRVSGIILPALIASVAGFIHILPFFIHSANPLGYDTGFYRRYLTEPFLSFPNAVVPGLGQDALLPRILLDTLRFLHLPTDLILYGSYALCFVALPVIAFLLLKRVSHTQTALGGALLLALSATNYNVYWYFLFKNALALCLIGLAFIAYEKRLSLLFILLSVSIALTHKTSAIVYLVTLGILFLLARGRRDIALAIASTTLAFVVVNLGLAHTIALSTPTAYFLTWHEYLALSAPLLILLPATIRELSSVRVPRPLLAFTGASFLFPVLHLPFYERIFAFSDVAWCLLAGFGVARLLRNIREEHGYAFWMSLATLCVASGLLLGTLKQQIETLAPLTTNENIATIAEIALLLPPGATLLTTSEEAPWHEGWTTAHVAAPGLLGDMHNLEAWTAFWNATSSEEKIDFLSDFPKPLYISTFGDIGDLLGTYPACIHEIRTHLLINECAGEAN